LRDIVQSKEDEIAAKGEVKGNLKATIENEHNEREDGMAGIR